MTQSANLKLAQLGKSSGLTLLRQGLAMLIAFASSVLMARVLGPERKGIFSVALLVPTTAITLLNLGIGPATVFHVARGTVSPGEALRNNLKLGLAIGAAAILLALLVIERWSGQLFPGVARLDLYVSLVYIPFGLMAPYSIAVVQGQQDFRSFNAIALVSQTAGLLLCIVLVWALRLGVVGAILALASGQLVSVLASVYVLRNRLLERARVSTGASLRMLLPYGLSTNVSNMADFAVRHADQFLVNLLLNPTQAGIYILAAGLAERLAIMAASPSAVMLPRISELEGADAIRQELTPIVARHVLWSVTLFSLCIMVVISAEVVSPESIFLKMPSARRNHALPTVASAI